VIIAFPELSRIHQRSLELAVPVRLSAMRWFRIILRMYLLESQSHAACQATEQTGAKLKARKAAQHAATAQE
jgi:hypothetical protein